MGDIHPQPTPEVESRDLEIAARDGRALAARLFTTPALGEPRALVVINGATGVPQRFYRHFARFLAAEGWAVLTYDYRGMGESRTGPLRRSDATMRQWGEEDFAGVLAWARQEYPRIPHALVGHSFGGQALGLADASQLDAVVLVAAQSGDVRHWQGRWYPLLMGLWWVLMPLASRAWGYFPGRLGVGGDLPSGVARQWARWCRTPGYLTAHVEGARETYRRVTAPVLAWSFEGDIYAPRPSVEALLGWLERAKVEYRYLEGEELPEGGLGHFGFFRPRTGEPYWREVGEWLGGWVG